MREMARRFASIASLLTLALLFGCGGSSGSTQPLAASALSPSSGDSFGISSDAHFLTVDTGAGLVFKVRL